MAQFDSADARLPMISAFRIALVTCKHVYSYDYARKCNGLAHFENLAVGYLAAVLEQHGFAPEIFSYPLQGFSRRGLVSALRNGKFQLVGFSVNSANTIEAIKVAQALPAGTHCCFGGYSASFAPDDLLAHECVDSVIVGEGEFAFLELAQALAEQRSFAGIPNLYTQNRRNPLRPLADLQRLPAPSRRELAEYYARGCVPAGAGRRLALVSGSRGCWGTCSFCYTTKFYRLARGPCIRQRDPGQLVDEVEELVRGPLGIEYIWFVDEEFIGRQPHRVLAFVSEMRRRGLCVPFEFDCRTDSVEESLFEELKSVGLVKVFLGVESFSQSFLNRVQKGIGVETNIQAIQILHRLGIDYRLGMIFFDAGTTLRELRENVEICHALDFARVNDPGRVLTMHTPEGPRRQVPKGYRARRVYEGLHAAIEREFAAAGRIDPLKLMRLRRRIGDHFLALVRERG